MKPKLVFKRGPPKPPEPKPVQPPSNKTVFKQPPKMPVHTESEGYYLFDAGSSWYIRKGKRTFVWVAKVSWGLTQAQVMKLVQVLQSSEPRPAKTVEKPKPKLKFGR